MRLTLGEKADDNNAVGLEGLCACHSFEFHQAAVRPHLRALWSASPSSSSFHT